MFEIVRVMSEIVRGVFTAGAALALLAFSGVTLGGSVIACIISTPLFVIFSPVLVPATIATTLLASGFTASGTFLGTAFSILAWLYKKRTGKDLPKIPGLNPSPSANPPSGN